MIAALTARAVALGDTALPGPGDAWSAEREGRTALPTSPLSSLVSDPSPRLAERLPAPR
ncbi:hypothetical protein [Parafrankia sp. FMc2]|uniref:hypothetical protein n=1 Tax=Parafrankia sp. FMc2 TaxID=3233196 RepID=UPI0034D43594